MNDYDFPSEVEEILDNIIRKYNDVFGGGITGAIKEKGKRASGGVIRSKVGGLVEDIAKDLVKATWLALGRNGDRLNFDRRKYKIPIRKKYVESIKVPEIKEYIQANISAYIYGISQDIHVYEGEQFILSVECKAYAENAMLKRIMVDSWFLKTQFPDLKFALIQLESQLGGDYSEVEKEVNLGSRPSHTIMSYFDVDLLIITLLEGARKVREPIHKKEFSKPLKKGNLRKAVRRLMKLLG